MALVSPSERADGRREIEHSGEAVGFLSENIAVYPDDRSAVVVLTNTWSSSAYRVMARAIAKVILPLPPVDTADLAATARARALFDQLGPGITRTERSSPKTPGTISPP